LGALPERNDLWLAGALAHASWGPHPGSHHVFPLYYRDASERTLLTPLCGWDGSGHFFYPLTPLAGVRTEQQTGSWLFPLYSHSRDRKNGDVTDHFLLFGGYAKNRDRMHAWFYPAFGFHDYGPLEAAPKKGDAYGSYGKKFWCLPFCWYENRCLLRPASKPVATATSAGSSNSQSSRLLPVEITKAPPVRTYTRKHGAFPLWSYATETTPAEGRSRTNGALFLLLYDFKHELKPAPLTRPGAASDYTRARVLWRLWHYERLNGDVSVDVFPAFTYDHKTDGFKKISFLWRFLRYERSATGAKKANVLFVPLSR
jgi:hypothetical protein